MVRMYSTFKKKIHNRASEQLHVREYITCIPLDYSVLFRRRQDVDHVTIVDRRTVNIEYIVIGYKHCKSQGH